MKVGDKVRFLSETGGGVIAGFQGNNIVLVEDEDGFQIPTSISDVVVVEADNYNIKPKVVKKVEVENEIQPSDLPITYKSKPEERKGGEQLSVYLAFVPLSVNTMSKTNFEAYIVNDSNYYLRYSYLSAENANWHMRSSGEIEPNTKIFIEEFGHDALNELDKVAVQMFAYKQGKSFTLKPTVDVQLRIDTVKFYKLHTFQENDFFEQPALLYTIIENDIPAKPLVIDAKKLKQEMAAKASMDRTKPTPARLQKRHSPDEPIVTDLHASELLETTSGMSSADILTYQVDVFKKKMDEFIGKHGQKLIFIHGKGDGVLRQAIIRELNHKYKNCSYQDASFKEYGYGATQVTIR